MVVEARGLVKKFGEVEAVRGLDFDVRPGECFGMLGPNGAGKSTTMRMIYRVTELTAGSLTVLGLPAGRADREIKGQIGVVPQMDSLDEELNVRENLIIHARYNDVDRVTARRRADEMLEFAGLQGRGDGPVQALSGGMKRRLTLARGLMNDPKLVVLDEPTTGLDPQVRLALWDQLSELRARGVTLVMTTHYMDEAERLCDRLVIVDGGRIVAQGTPRELIAQHVSPYVIEGRGIGQEAEALGVPLRRAVDRVSLYVDDPAPILEKLGHPAQLFVRPGNLEDVFLNLTGHSLRE